MNKLSEEQIIDLLNEYDVSDDVIDILEDIFSEYYFTEDEYYNLIVEIIYEYQSLKINKELESGLASPYKDLKDIIIKVLKYKLNGVTHNNSKYKNEVNALILILTNK